MRFARPGRMPRGWRCAVRGPQCTPDCDAFSARRVHPQNEAHLSRHLAAHLPCRRLARCVVHTARGQVLFERQRPVPVGRARQIPRGVLGSWTPSGPRPARVVAADGLVWGNRRGGATRQSGRRLPSRPDSRSRRLAWECRLQVTLVHEARPSGSAQPPSCSIGEEVLQNANLPRQRFARQTHRASRAPCRHQSLVQVFDSGELLRRRHFVLAQGVPRR